jgi:light-regulated signal transduction histidine kinase (bacteriophytochrome)
MAKKAKRQQGKRALTKRKSAGASRRKGADDAVDADEIGQYKTALEAAEDELESFCYSVSHDLRAPLRCIDGFSHALQHEFGSRMEPQAREYLERIVEAGKKMGRLIDELLSISRIQRIELSREDFNLADLAREIAAQLKAKNPTRNVKLVIPAKLSVNGDGKLVALLLERLLDNAWKFTSKVPSPRIEVGEIEIGPERGIFVRDNGIGFDMEQAPKLFKAFQRLHSQADYPGLGTGLALARAIVRRHGGRIWAESSPHSGATFYFTLGNPHWH